jgi:hypothetical protein
VSTSNSTRLERDEREHALVEQKMKVSDYLQTARNNLVPEKSKAEVDTITNKLLDRIDVDEHAEDNDF